MTAHPSSQARAGEAIPSLDGIRAIAVSLVFFAHSGLENAVPGGLGVTIFFVLSGFLITTLMRVECGRTGGLDFRNFYLRRFLRLMPPLLIVTAAAGALSAFGLAQGGFTPQGLLSVLFYFGNYFVIAHDFNGIPAGIGVVWSLAVEEHYYLLYPPLALLLLLRLRRPAGRAAVLAALCAMVLAWRFWLLRHGGSEAHLTMATDTRVDAILVGCLMALWRNPWLDRAAAASGGLRDSVIAAACLAALAATLAYRDDTFRLTARYTVQSLAIAPLIYLAVARAADAPFRWLNARPLAYLGGVSYAVYLSHQVILFMVQAHCPRLGWLATTMLTAALTLAFAECMRRWVEQPCARLRKRLHRRPAAAQALPGSLPASAR
ncbi:MAG: acyltransferase [Nevskia sp.]|nr:acyltransferase [Nevskia sp.]